MCMEEVVMSESFEGVQEHSESLDQPQEVDRRTVLRRGAKLAYIAPVVIIAMQAGNSAEAPPIPTGPIPSTIVSPPPING